MLRGITVKYEFGSKKRPIKSTQLAIFFAELAEKKGLMFLVWYKTHKK